MLTRRRLAVEQVEEAVDRPLGVRGRGEGAERLDAGAVVVARELQRPRTRRLGLLEPVEVGEEGAPLRLESRERVG